MQHLNLTPAMSYRILIVDDEEIVALGFQGGLQDMSDCDVFIETHAEQVLARFEERPFDLLITDYRMPKIDGVSLARHVKELYPDTAIIMVTAYASARLIEQAKRVPIQHVLDKPVTLERLRRVTLEVLDREEFR